MSAVMGACRLQSHGDWPIPLYGHGVPEILDFRNLYEDPVVPDRTDITDPNPQLDCVDVRHNCTFDFV